MPPWDVNDSKHWRDRAAEMRILSTMMEHIETQAIMVRLADDYDKMADRADRAGIPIRNSPGSFDTEKASRESG